MKTLRNYLMVSLISFPVSFLTIPDANAHNMNHQECTEPTSTQSIMSEADFKEKTACVTKWMVNRPGKSANE